MKVTVVGAGAVGATCADNIARLGLVHELVILDIKEGISEGKAQDIMQTAALLGFDTKVSGSTNDYAKTSGSDIVIITSGLPRKPGMTREELIGVNAGIVKSVAQSIIAHSPNAIFIVVSNPMDTMTYLALTTLGLPKNKIIGMGGALDSARFKFQLSQALQCSPADLNAVVIGGHGDTTMIPLIGHATWNSTPVNAFLDENQKQQIINDTMTGGAILTKLLGTSAWYAPGAATASVVASIAGDKKRLIPCSVLLEGEYGQQDICMGVPVIIGKSGWEKIIEFNLTDAEKEEFAKSAAAVRSMNDVLKTL